MRIRYLIVLSIIGLASVLVGQIDTHAPEVAALYKQYLERDFDACKSTLEAIDRNDVSTWDNESKELYWSLYSRYYLIVEKSNEKYASGLVALGAFENEVGSGLLAQAIKTYTAAFQGYQNDNWAEADGILELMIQDESMLSADPVLEGEIHLLASEIKIMLADREGAIAANKKAIKVWENIDAHARSAYASRHLADYFSDIREPSEALLYFEKALESYSQAHGDAHATVAGCYASIGLVHGNIRNFDYSATAFKKGIRIYEVLEPIPEKELADAYDDLGFIYCNYNSDSAIHYIRKGLRLRRKVFKEPNQQVARSYNSLGTYFRYLERPNLDSAIHYFNLEIGTWELLEPENNMNGLRYFELARTCMSMNDFDKARSAFRHGLQRLTQSPSANYVDSLPSYQSFVIPSLGLDAMYYLSQYYERLQVSMGDTDAIFNTMKCADLTLQINDSIWSYYSLTGAKLSLSNLTYPMLGYGVSAAFDAYERTGQAVYMAKALHYAESRKAMMLSESFERSLSDTVMVPQEVRKQEASINYKLSHYQAEQEKTREYPQKFDQSHAKKVSRQVINYLHKRDSMADEIKKRWPTYFQKKTLLSLPSLDDVRAKLDSNTLLLTYSVHIPVTNDTTDEINCLLITKGGIQMQRLMLDSSLSNDIARLRKLIAQKDYNEYISLANKLYKMLFEPLNIHEQNVVVIPEGSLAEVPFDALLKTLPQPDTPKDFAQLDYLIKHKAISYANSVWYWYYTHNERPAIAPEVWGLAPFK